MGLGLGSLFIFLSSKGMARGGSQLDGGGELPAVSEAAEDIWMDGASGGGEVSGELFDYN